MQQVARKRGQQKEKLMTQAGSSPGDSHPRQSHFRGRLVQPIRLLEDPDPNELRRSLCVLFCEGERGWKKQSVSLRLYSSVPSPEGKGTKVVTWVGWGLTALPPYRCQNRELGSYNPPRCFDDPRRSGSLLCSRCTHGWGSGRKWFLWCS